MSEKAPKSAELYGALLEADAQRDSVEDAVQQDIDTGVKIGISDRISNAYDRHVVKRNVKKAERLAKKDYRQNQNAYQDEALHDAIADGVDINVPEPSTRIKHKGVAERIAYAGKENMDKAVELRNERLPEAKKKLGEFLLRASVDSGWMSPASATQALVETIEQRIAQEESYARLNWEWAEQDEAEISARRKAQREARAQKNKVKV